MRVYSEKHVRTLFTRFVIVLVIILFLVSVYLSFKLLTSGETKETVSNK